MFRRWCKPLITNSFARTATHDSSGLRVGCMLFIRTACGTALHSDERMVGINALISRSSIVPSKTMPSFPVEGTNSITNDARVSEIRDAYSLAANRKIPLARAFSENQPKGLDLSLPTAQRTNSALGGKPAAACRSSMKSTRPRSCRQKGRFSRQAWISRVNVQRRLSPQVGSSIAFASLSSSTE